MIANFHNTFNANKKDIDLFYILAGQSNALGQTGSTNPTRSELIGDIPNAFIWDGSDYNTLNFPLNNQGDNFASELSFSYAYTTQIEKSFYLEKVALGGTPIFQDPSGLDWNVNSNELYEDLEAALLRLKNKSIALGSANPKFVLTWIQGERDARFADGSANYYTNFVDIVNELELTQPLDLVIMNVLNDNLINGIGYNLSELNNVINSQKLLAANNAKILNIDMNRYTLGSDVLHYDANEQEIIGDDLFNIVKRHFKI